MTNDPSLSPTNLEGLAEATDILREFVTPWRRDHAKKLAKLEAAKRQAELHRLNADVLSDLAMAQRTQSAEVDRSEAELMVADARKKEAEAALIYAEAAKVRAETEMVLASIRQARIELALKIVEQYSSGLDEAKKIDFVLRLLPTLDTLTSSPLEVINDRPSE